MFDRKSDDYANAQLQLVEDRDAITDAYNYAAKFDLELSVQAEEVSKRDRRGRKYLQVTLALPDQGIKAMSVGYNYSEAETRAALNFKKEAEKYQIKTGAGELIVKDATALTTDSCLQFFEFLEITRPGLQVSTTFLEKKTPSLTTNNANICQVIINGQAMGRTFTSSTKHKARIFALLSMSIHIKKRFPEIFPQFVRALRTGNGSILRPVNPIHVDVDDDIALVMQETLLSARKAGLPDAAEEVVADVSVIHNGMHVFRHTRDPQTLDQLSTVMRNNLTRFRQNPVFQGLIEAKESLPMNQYRSQVLEIVNGNPYSIIIGATGSGKTTQVPQILLEERIDANQGSTCNIICTQPRRIAAISVSQRVAHEKGERLKQSVGYQIRADSKLAPLGGSITYCTTGILLQQLQTMPDAVFDNTSHIVIDEVHERDILIDFLLVLLKKIISRRKSQGKSVPRLVLMSATIDTELFANYLRLESTDGTVVKCPTLSVPGRAFPVQERYLDEILEEMNNAGSPLKKITLGADDQTYLDSERTFRNTTTVSEGPVRVDRSVIDWKRERKQSTDGEIVIDDKVASLVPLQLIAHTVAHIVKGTKDGAILIFLPGMDEILKLEALLKETSLGVDFRNAQKFKIYKLHSAVPDAQTAVFEKVPAGCRKIIISTNVAETSVTIPDVQHVVDSGKLREKQYDQVRRITSLVCTWISKSNAKQRAGRAGRVQNGNYYAMYSKERYDSLRPIGLPEMLRSDLQEVCLDVKAQAFDTPVREFLAGAIEPPSPKAVDISVVNLQKLDALTDEEEITSLGRLLASLPVHPNLGKMIVLGIIFRCLDPILILGSVDRTLFMAPLEARREAQRAKIAFVEGTGSDHMALLHAVRELRRVRTQEGENAMRDFAYRNFLHLGTFRMIEDTTQQIEEILVHAGLIPYTPAERRQFGELGSRAMNENSHRTPLIKGLLLAGLHPNLAVGLGGALFRTVGESRTLLHPASINAQDVDETSRKEMLRHKPGKLFTYSAMARSNDGRTIFLRETTESTPLQAAIFGGRVQLSPDQRGIIHIDDWLSIHLHCHNPRVPQTVIEFRKALERMLISAFRSLGKAARSIKAGRAPETYLADNEVRSLFAASVVEVLNRDSSFTEDTLRRGWGGAKRGS